MLQNSTSRDLCYCKVVVLLLCCKQNHMYLRRDGFKGNNNITITERTFSWITKDQHNIICWKRNIREAIKWMKSKPYISSDRMVTVSRIIWATNRDWEMGLGLRMVKPQLINYCWLSKQCIMIRLREKKTDRYI